MHHFWYECGLNMRRLFIIYSPAVSELIEAADNCPVWLCVLIIGASVVIATQSKHTRFVYAGQSHHLGGEKQRVSCKKIQSEHECISTASANVHPLPAWELPSKRTERPKSVESIIKRDFVFMLTPRVGV